MRITISHSTVYQYSQAQHLIVQSHRLCPVEANSQRRLRWQVQCEQAQFGGYFVDGAGDRIRTMTLSEKCQSLQIDVEGEVETTDCNGVISIQSDRLHPLSYLRSSTQTQPATTMISTAATLKKEFSTDRLALAHQLMALVHEKIEYQAGSTESAATVKEVWSQGKGVCQDQTHCLLSLARHCSIPARYVTGYFFTDDDAEAHLSSHAWAELFIQDLGWVGFDTTHNCSPGEKYLRLGSGIDANEAALIRGISRGQGDERMQTSVKIQASQ